MNIEDITKYRDKAKAEKNIKKSGEIMDKYVTHWMNIKPYKEDIL